MEIIEINTNSEQYSLDNIADFLFEHLDQYGDDISSIKRCIQFSQGQNGGLGGFVLAAAEDNEVVGAVVINKTGMGGYIPENILVYIAMHRRMRGKGLGKQLMKAAINKCEGDVALHVEKDNPARFLYEDLGFTNPYLEMRLKRNGQ